jgi:hypothetical protein
MMDVWLLGCWVGLGWVGLVWSIQRYLLWSGSRLIDKQNRRGASVVFMEVTMAHDHKSVT